MYSTGYRFGVASVAASLALGLAGAPPAVAQDGPADVVSPELVAPAADGSASQPRIADTGDRPRQRGFSLVAQVYLKGAPVRGARVSVATASGERLRLLPGTKRRTSGQGYVILDVAGPAPSTFVVTATGGQLASGRSTSATLTALARRGDTFAPVNMGTTLLVDYRAQHPNLSLGVSLKRLAGYLRLPRLMSGSFRLPQYSSMTHLQFMSHDPAQWYRRAMKHGGVTRYVARVARQVEPGRHVRPPLTPTDYVVDTFGRDGTVFRTSTRWVGAATASRRQTRGVVADALGGFQSLMQWGLGNLAQSAACQVAHSNLAQAFLACAPSTNTSGITKELNSISASLDDLIANVQILQRGIDSATLNNLVNSLYIPTMYKAVKTMTGYANTLASYESTSPGVLTVDQLTQPPPYAGISQLTNYSLPNPISGQSCLPQVVGTPPDLTTFVIPSSGASDCNITTPAQTVCSAAYGLLSPQSGNLTSTADNACTQIASILNDIADDTSMATALDDLYTSMSGVNEVDVSDMLIMQAQQDLAFGGAAFTSGGNQNQINQTFAGIVEGQMSALQFVLAWQSFYETWMVGQPQNCYVLSNDPTVATSSLDLSAPETSCGIAQQTNQDLSILRYIADNGAAASLPNLNTPTTAATQQGPGVVLDTVASLSNPPVYWAMPVDLSGASLHGDNGGYGPYADNSDGVNDYWPFYPQGDALGASTTEGYTYPGSQPPPLFSPTVPRPLVIAYPKVDFVLQADEGALQQLLTHAWDSDGGTAPSVNAALSHVGFVGPGMGMTDLGNGNWTGMNWNYLVAFMTPVTGATWYVYPTWNANEPPKKGKQPGVENISDCPSNWPNTTANGQPTGYGCVDIQTNAIGQVEIQVTGTYGTTFFNTPATGTGGLTPQGCPSTYGVLTDPAGVTQTDVCVGPGSNGAGSYYALLVGSVSNPTWTAAMFPCGAGDCGSLPARIASLAHDPSWPTASVTSATASPQTITVTGTMSPGSYAGTAGTITPQCGYWPYAQTTLAPPTLVPATASTSGGTTTYTCVITGLAVSTEYYVAMAPAQAEFTVGKTTIAAVTVFSDSTKATTPSTPAPSPTGTAASSAPG